MSEAELVGLWACPTCGTVRAMDDCSSSPKAGRCWGCGHMTRLLPLVHPDTGDRVAFYARGDDR